VGCSNKNDVAPENYYISQKLKLLKNFDKIFDPGKSILVASMDETLADQILKEARIEYEAIIPRIPYIGGEENISTQHIVGASQCLAVYRTICEKFRSINLHVSPTYSHFKRLLKNYDLILSIDILTRLPTRLNQV